MNCTVRFCSQVNHSERSTPELAQGTTNCRQSGQTRYLSVASMTRGTLKKTVSRAHHWDIELSDILQVILDDNGWGEDSTPPSSTWSEFQSFGWLPINDKKVTSSSLEVQMCLTTRTIRC